MCDCRQCQAETWQEIRDELAGLARALDKLVTEDLLLTGAEQYRASRGSNR